MSPTNHTGSGNQLKVEFWGVRGSIPTPERTKVALGGNTPCTVIQYNTEPVLIIDGGTGLRSFGVSLPCNPQNRVRASLLVQPLSLGSYPGPAFFWPCLLRLCSPEFLFHSPSG